PMANPDCQKDLAATPRTMPSSVHCRRKREFSTRSAMAGSSRQNWMSPRGSHRHGITIPLHCNSRAACGTTYPWSHLSPILREKAPSSRRGIHCSTMRRLIGTGMQSSGSGLTGVPNAFLKRVTGTRAICTLRANGSTNITPSITVTPSRFGYKDLCAQWTLLNWEPDELIARYKKAGARIFVALANHHDGFDAWNSKHQPWNSAAIGPHRDVVGTWAAAARKQG